MVQHYFFSNILTHTISTIILGTFFAYLLYFFSYINQYQNLIKHDILYNMIKVILVLSLGISYTYFIVFLYYYYTHYLCISTYSIFFKYKLIPVIYVNFFFF